MPSTPISIITTPSIIRRLRSAALAAMLCVAASASADEPGSEFPDSIPVGAPIEKNAIVEGLDFETRGDSLDVVSAD